MSEQLFRVVFDGSLTGDFDETTAKKRFGRLFHLNSKRVNTLFSGKYYVIKNNVTESQAMEFMIKVSECGCECSVQEMPDEDEPDDDKRKGEERRLRFRRPPRTGAIVPDRRLEIRRKKDRKYFTELKKQAKAIPLAFESYPDINKDI